MGCRIIGAKSPQRAAEPAQRATEFFFNILSVALGVFSVVLCGLKGL
jgi:hypothetical protein